MMPPQQPNNPGYQPSSLDAGNPREPRGRANVWDVISTVAVSIVLVIGAGMAAWMSLYFGQTRQMCHTDGCPAIPLGRGEWFYPVTWGGTLGAFVIAAIGPFVSLRWHRPMWIWPVIAIVIVIASYIAGYAMTGFGERYSHEDVPSIGVPLPLAPPN